MKTSAIKQVTQRYLDRIEELKRLESKETSGHFGHIAGTLGVGVKGYTELVDIGLDWREIRGEYNKHRRLLRDYLRLMDKFKDFRAAELTVHNGYFPDTRDEGAGGAENYVTESKKRLIK